MKSFIQFLVEELSASESIFGLMGWLTSRKKRISLSSTDDASEAAEVIDKWSKANNLKPPRKDWHMKIVHPITELTYGEYNTRRTFVDSDPDKEKKTVGSTCLKCQKGKYSDAFDHFKNAVCPRCGDQGITLEK